MNTLAVLRELSGAEWRSIRRDSMLRGMLILVLLLALLTRWLIPWVSLRFDLDLAPHYPLIMSALVVFLAPVLVGFIVGMLLLDERDEGVLQALSVTPLPKWQYLAWKLSWSVAATTILTVLTFPIVGWMPFRWSYRYGLASRRTPLWSSSRKTTNISCCALLSDARQQRATRRAARCETLRPLVDFRPATGDNVVGRFRHKGHPNMKVGVFTVILRSMPFEQALDYLAALGVQTVEIGAGAFPGTDHCDADELLASDAKANEFLDAIHSRGLQISCLSVHGNPIHPNREIAAEHHAAFERCVRLAAKLGVEVVATFSGCPGGAPGDAQPNWVTCPWPPEYLDILDYQWKDVVIPYWRKTTAFAREQGIHKIALEMHPGFVVYNPETLLKLRQAAGPEIGANFDPSHLIWQGIDPCAAVRALAGAIWHVHAKDTHVQTWNSRTNGVLDAKHYGDELNRSWLFRTVGYGSPRKFWCDFISALRMVGYDHALSIEHEDSLMTAREGLEKAIGFLQEIVLNEPKGDLTWA